MAYNNASAYPKFSWSFSRSKAFNTCLRSYWFQYYASHKGWERDAPPDAKEAYRLKNVSSLHEKFGQHVREAIRMAMVCPSNPADIKAYVRDSLRRDCQMALNLMAWQKTPKQNPTLLEVLNLGGFKSEPSKAASALINERIEKLDAFFETSTWKDILAGGKLVECGESLDKIGSFMLPVGKHELQVWTQTGCIHIPPGEKKYVITIWRLNDDEITSDVNDTECFKTLIYVMYVHMKYGVPVEDILVRRANILNGESSEYSFNDEQLGLCKEKIIREVAGMAKLLENGLMENKPKDVSCFGRNPSLACRRCKFRRACGVTEMEDAETNNLETENKDTSVNADEEF